MEFASLKMIHKNIQFENNFRTFEDKDKDFDGK